MGALIAIERIPAFIMTLAPAGGSAACTGW